METAKIVSLQAQNIKKLKAVHIRPDGNLIVIGGGNGEGKTSVLDAIMYALAGKRAVCDKPVREGEERGQVTLDLGDLVVTRTFTAAGGGMLKVTGKNGAKFGSPQAMLDKLIGSLTFDPLAFARMDSADQLQTLRDLVGINTADLDRERAGIFEGRTEVGRDIKRLEGQLAGLPVINDAPAAEVSVVELSRELQRRRDSNSVVSERERRRDALYQSVDTLSASIESDKVKMADAKERLRAATAKRDEVEKSGGELKNTMAAKEAEADELRARLRAVEKEIGDLAEEKKKYESVWSELSAGIAQHTSAVNSLAASISEAEQKKSADLTALNTVSQELVKSALEDTDEIEKQISEAEQINARYRDSQKRQQVAADLAAAQKKRDEMTAQIEEIDRKKEGLLAAAQFPVDGLAIGDQGVTFGEVPFAQASSAEQLRVSVAMGMAMNPGLRVIRIQDGSLLDQKSLAMIAEMAQEKDYQVWMERVGDGKEVTVVIEDGSIRVSAESAA